MTVEPTAESGAHAATLHGDRVVCTCGDFNCASLDYTACSFALGRGGYCKGDVRFPATHSTLCPGYSASVTPPGVPMPDADYDAGPKRIQRRRTKGWKMPKGAVYVGRGTPYGNPFRIVEHCKSEHGDWGVEDSGRFCLPYGHGWTRVGAARAAVNLYRLELDAAYPEGSTARSILALNLRGKDLACWCPLDQPCHADVLLEIANSACVLSPAKSAPRR